MGFWTPSIEFGTPYLDVRNATFAVLNARCEVLNSAIAVQNLMSGVWNITARVSKHAHEGLQLRQVVEQPSMRLIAANIGKGVGICHGDVSVELTKPATSGRSGCLPHSTCSSNRFSRLMTAGLALYRRFNAARRLSVPAQ